MRGILGEPLHREGIQCVEEMRAMFLIAGAREDARDDVDWRPTPGSFTMTPMTEDRFWALIGTTTAFAGHPQRQLSALRETLEKLSAEDVAAFDLAFDQQMNRAYSWDLWGAAYLVNGGASDDGFEYFRRWLIAQGREVFQKVLADPDSLADILPESVLTSQQDALHEKDLDEDDLDEGGLDEEDLDEEDLEDDADDEDLQGEDLEFEDFGYVAMELWEQKTGRSADEMPRLEHVEHGEPYGTKLEESNEHLARRYPKLWRRLDDAGLLLHEDEDRDNEQP